MKTTTLLLLRGYFSVSDNCRILSSSSSSSFCCLHEKHTGSATDTISNGSISSNSLNERWPRLQEPIVRTKANRIEINLKNLIQSNYNSFLKREVGFSLNSILDHLNLHIHAYPVFLSGRHVLHNSLMCFCLGKAGDKTSLYFKKM